MGYADTLPYQQLKMFTGLKPYFDITNAVDDYEGNTFHIPDFKRPISYATLEIHYTSVLNNSAVADNRIQGVGSFGIKDNGGTFRAADAFLAYNIYAPAAGGYYHGDCCLPGLNDLTAYITPDTVTIRPMFYQVQAQTDTLRVRNIYGVLNLYFNI